MKRLLLYTAAALVFASCTKEAPTPGKGDDAEKFTKLSVPASFEWKTTRPVTCDFTAAHPSRVYVASARGAEPFASFIVGGDAGAVQLDLPTAASTLYVSYETETGVSAQEALPVTESAVAFSMAAKGKDYTGIEDGDKNSTVDNVIYMPAHTNGWGTLMFEDLWPAYGDFDFNDFVVNYKVQLYMSNKNKVRQMQIGVRVKAVGGSIPYDFCLALQGVHGGQIENIERLDARNAPNARLVALNSQNWVKDPAILRFENIRENANRPSGAAYVNTEEGYEMSEDQLVEARFMVTFRNSIAIENVAFDKFDFFISRERESDGRRIEIHRAGYVPTPDGEADYKALASQSTYTNKAGKFYYSNEGLVWAINIPHDICHAYEKVDFLKAYPEMKTWAQSGGTQAKDWYEHGVDKYRVKTK